MEDRFKRLSSSIDYYYCVDTKNNNQGLTEEDMLDKLNELAEERDYFRKRKCQYEHDYSWVLTENIQLKQLISEYGDVRMKKKMELILGEKSK